MKKKHNHAFTSAVIDHILSDESDENMIRVKSDNCSTQYKCKWVFRFYNNLAIEKQVKILVYYGVSGHGKGLVDAMSSFGVKAPLLRAVITTMLKMYTTTWWIILQKMITSIISSFHPIQ